ncbi:fungal-specific transcription factor domain-containing protein [Bisporella sp. PMI_857]|nr:fungal-specific transcription factor domain-containing protein [Bisporella sp. PMI_857]
MPRPKKAGAPEPKKRSRNGCWPCKNRKVKCDETHPTCQNCRRQGETCDYSIRLNWEGRGKKKDSPAGPGQINFSNGGPSTPQTAESPPGQMTQGSLPVVGFASHLQPTESSRISQQPIYSLPHVDLAPPRALDRDNSMIDPALMAQLNPPSFRNDLYPGGPPEYAQSYERYRSLTPNTSVLGPSAPPRSAMSQAAKDSSISPPEHGFRSPVRQSRSFDHVDTMGSNKDGTSTARLERPPKRARYQLDQAIAGLSHDIIMPPPNVAAYSPHNPESQASSVIIAAPSSIGTPLTPASSHSDDIYKHYSGKLSSNTPNNSPEHRRLSVSSLLSGPTPAVLPHQTYRSGGCSIDDLQDWSLKVNGSSQDTTYGVDRGFRDLDIGNNDDENAISGSSPTVSRDHLESKEGELFSPIEFGFGTEVANNVFQNGTYYDNPVPICVPKVLEPLPSKLLENPMNLLYFHHFLNHTADCLVPHNCSSNPFKSILPQMAVSDENLMNLLLAYSASHRARHLRQPEPATRIALWVQDIFPNLRHALDDPNAILSNANLATAIMLASLEIISPKAFGVEVPWQNHLDMARQIIAARGGPQRMQTASRGDKVSSFLWSWFAYLDVLGSLSGGRSNSPSSSWILDYETDVENEYSIDCILGFTNLTLTILAKIAELSRICDNSRIGPDHTIRADWRPSRDVISRAEKLEAELAASRLHPVKSCTHMQSSGEAIYSWDSLEMTATNAAFHWAGLVHLHRRILGKPSTHDDVQSAVCEIVGALHRVRKGSSAEACLLFPMFTAGCDARDEKQRADILDRIKSVERTGMTQVHKARKLMERVWQTGKPWETLVAGEFFG